jgi:sodium-dependent dicarboxylate transporter 2/3/5
MPNRKQEGEKLMDWNECKKLLWNLILLHGAGFALADEVQSSGLVDVPLDFLEDAPYLAIAPAVGPSIFTEFITSNDDITTLIIQLLYHIARTMHYACTSSSSNDPRSNCN